MMWSNINQCFFFFNGVFFFYDCFLYHDAKHEVVDIDEAWEVSLCCVKLMSPTDA